MEITCATQHPMNISETVASVLNVDQNKIITKTKRLGGAFGGKEIPPISVTVAAAIAASKLNRPVRCMLDRDEDMMMTGKRHPAYGKYKCAFDKTGKILAYEMYIYLNCGYANGQSFAVLAQAMLKLQNTYNIQNVRVVGHLCKTNLPSNDAFRAFGAPQSTFMTEMVIRQVAEYLKKDSIEVAQLNFFKDGDTTSWNQKLENVTIERCWSECIQHSNFFERRKEVETYNQRFSTHIAWGVEMGQGLHTKIIQIASQTLQIPPSKIFINETSTDKVPNAPASVASLSTEFCGSAVKNPNSTWEKWILDAYMNRVSLSATGFYKHNFLGYNVQEKTENPYNYFSYGVACTEVEIDCLTGDHQLLRTDIVMDVGCSINPAIDVGQIEGAFIQGYGLYMLEEIMYSPDGLILTKGPGTYKLPGFDNAPHEFNVYLLKDAPNPKAIYSSKAIGEPPLCLASSILFAAREAIKSAREDHGLHNTKLYIDAPLTSAKIRMACEDHITSKLETPILENYRPWNVII
ncbi:hypothetical protein FQR65_LT03429 [Abscondita terminalis]|nr:hypothetical protein FQR65_LT03429 [Abscondita terminalis]